MPLTLFCLPLETRLWVYSFVFAESNATIEFDEDAYKRPAPTLRRSFITVSSSGNLGFLRASKQCYADAIDSYQRARTVRICNLNHYGLEDFKTLSQFYTTARMVEFDHFGVDDLSTFPSFPKLQRLIINGVKMWAGNLIVQKGQSADEAFDEGNVLNCLFQHVRYSSLNIEEGVSKYFPHAHIVINFRVGNQVMDKNVMRGIQDWDWACSYDVKAGRLNKRLVHRLTFW